MAAQRQESNAYVDLEQAVFTKLPQLHSVLVRNDGDAVGLQLKHRGPSDWIAVLRRDGHAGGPEVAFGTGFDVIGCLLGLEGALAADRWREDKPWTP